MCKYVYKSKRRLDERCNLSEYFGLTDNTYSLPTDEAGMCIFHSTDPVWKKANNFKSHFLKLISIVDGDKHATKHDFSEFKFVGCDAINVLSKKRQGLKIEGCIFNKDVTFEEAIFLEAFEIANSEFHSYVSLDNVVFSDVLNINETRFHKGVKSELVKFHGYTKFEDVDFFSFAIFDGCEFLGDTVYYKTCNFSGMTRFCDSTFTPTGSDSNVVFRSVKFDDSVDFSRTKFHNLLTFDNVKFSDHADFIDTLFDNTMSSFRYVGAAVEFTNIEVSKSATLSFKGTDPSDKLFRHDALISFKNDPLGLVEFENVNYEKLTPESRERLARLEKIGRVYIGRGCVKYRHQTDIKKISVNRCNAPLIIEICQTFTNYFSVNNGINLGLEIVERKKNEIHFFYYTDENISEDIFCERLKDTEKNIWSLLSQDRKEEYLAIESNKNHGANEDENYIINAVDGISAMLGIFFRVGVRVALGKWKERDTKSLLDAISFSVHDSTRLAGNIHRVIVDKYTGEALVALNSHQNESLSQAINITYNMNGYNSRVYQNSIDCSENTVELKDK